nr:MAG TPA: nucleoside triphosphate pyrophosphohydrolase [Caudoviricetes sp.]
MCMHMRARKYSIYIKSLEGVSERIRFQGQKSTRKGDTEMTVNDSKRFHFLMHEIDARINNETMDRYGIERQSLVAMEELAELQKAISKLVRNSEEKTKSLEFKGLRHNLIEEMADVIICMDQLKEYYNINHAEIQSIIASKQERQAKRLEEE